MKKGDNICGYVLTSEGSTRGGGRSFSAFATKERKEYFVKQFTTPKYPIDGSPGSPATKAKALEKCRKFEARNFAIKEAISGGIASGGSVVAPIDFFRNGTFYYKIYEKIDVAALTSAEISGLSLSDKLLIMQVVAHSVGILHGFNIVHGDLKPDNILIKATDKGAFTAKLIDFDDAYFSGAPPESETIVGDQVYYSPELLTYIINDNEKITKKLAEQIGLQSDIFALGLVFLMFVSGKLPSIAAGGSAAAIVNTGKKMDLRGEPIPSELAELFSAMLAKFPKERPSAHEVRDRLKKFGRDEREYVAAPSVSKSPTETSGLKIKVRPPSPPPSPEAPEDRPATVSGLKIKRRPS